MSLLPPERRPLRVAMVGMGGVTKQFRHWPERVIGRALVRRGHSVVNIAYHDPKHPALTSWQEEIDGIQVRRVPVRHWPNNRLRAALEATGPFDVMYLQHPRNVLAYGATRWAQAQNIPTVYTWNGPFHDRYLVDDRERPYDEQPKYERIIWSLLEVLRRTWRDGRLRDHLRNYWLHWPIAAANALMPISQHEADCVRTAGLTQSQFVVPQWLDFAAIEAAPLNPPDLPRPALLFIGQLSPRKGYDLLLRALPAVLDCYPTATVLMVSGLNQEDRAKLDQMAQELGIAERVQVLGRVEDSELVNLYRAADLYITPTRYEGFGLTLLEAMTAGCPLISTDIPVVNETVQHGVNGWLTRYDDPQDLARGILTLLDDEVLRRRLVAGGHQTIATRFREDLLAARVEDVFYGVLDNSAAGSR
ncbi:MAG: glycosyltransferase family 4 protein [Chloroflexi bacterium]|nr:glycosyltransferase family 4 protein [Chloroflexota bacterium]